MNEFGGLDLSALSQFKAADLMTGQADSHAPGVPMRVALDRIGFDPAQPRRRMLDSSIDELAESIRQHGVLEPVSLRRDPQQTDRYVVNRGERRVRAARRADLAVIPAFVDERLDPFAQAAENLHREDMSPLDLSAFIFEREREGHSRAEIARRLGKPRSFITEVASLNHAPAELRQAVEEGRLGADVRVLYQLTALARDRPQQFKELLSQAGGPIGRSRLEDSMARSPSPELASAAPPPAGASGVPRVTSGGRTVLVVAHGGRRGSLRIKAQDNNVGEVRFGDGTRALLPLAELQPVCWATEE